MRDIDDAMVEAAAARKTPWWSMLVAAANNKRVWAIKNEDGTVDLSPIGRKGTFIARNLTMPQAIGPLDREYDPTMVGGPVAGSSEGRRASAATRGAPTNLERK
jgi:hypothetical protein